MTTYEALPIDEKRIRSWIEYDKFEFNKTTTREEAIAGLEKLKAQGCLLYEDCRNCPLFYLNEPKDQTCPL